MISGYCQYTCFPLGEFVVLDGWLAGWLADENDALCYNCKHDSGKLDHPTLSYIRTAPG